MSSRARRRAWAQPVEADSGRRPDADADRFDLWREWLETVSAPPGM